VLVEASDTKPHNAPELLLIVQLDGTVEVEVSDGECGASALEASSWLKTW
jgi:hypothetical protein